MQAQAQQTGQQIGGAVGGSIKSYLAGFSQQFADINKHLNEISQNSRRTGTSIARGASDGAAGLRDLATAGLGALAAIKSVQAAVESMTGAAARGANLNRMAGLIGVTPTWLDSFAQAAQNKSNVPQDATINAINQYRQQIEAQRQSGTWADSFTALQRIGVNVTSGSIEDQLKQIETALAGRRGPEAQYWLGQTPLAPLVNFLKQGPQAVGAAQGQAGASSLSGDQADELDKLQQAANRAANSYTHLWETITSDFSKNGLRAALEGFADWTNTISHNEDDMKILEGTLGAIATIMGVTMVAAIGKLTKAFAELTALPLLRFIINNPGLVGPLGAFFGTLLHSNPAGEKPGGDPLRFLSPEQRARIQSGTDQGNAVVGSAPIPPANGTVGGDGATVKGSVFGWPGNRDSGPQANGQSPYDGPGIALPSDPARNAAVRAGQGGWYDVTFPNGKTLRLQQTDIGPSQDPAKTGGHLRGLDVNAAAAAQAGYNEGNFPTDSDFTVTPVTNSPSGNFSIHPGVRTDAGQEAALVDIARHASAALPEGYRVEMTSGYRPGGSASPVGMHSQHALGLAADFQIVGPNGPIPNEGADTTGMYGRLASASRDYQMRNYPQFNPYWRWGGTFGSRGGPISTDSPADLMHFDLRGYSDAVASANGNRTTTQNIDHGDINAGGITVNVANGGDPYAIGGAVKNSITSLSKTRLVQNSNTSLE